MNAYRYRLTFAGAEPARVLDVLADDADSGAQFAGLVGDALVVELVHAVDVDALEAGPTCELVPHEWDGFGVHDPNTCDTCEMLATVELELVQPFRAWLEQPAGMFADWLARRGAQA